MPTSIDRGTGIISNTGVSRKVKVTDHKTILIVDDELHYIRAMERNLGKYLDAVNIRLASSGHEAIEILRTEIVDLIVADFMMPEMTGLDLLFRIRSQWPNIDIIIMTGHCTSELKETAGKNGCSQIFEKPFPMETMRNAVTRILSKRKKGFSGILKRIQLSDLIQMCCMDGVSETIRVVQGSEEGFIYIDNGEIVHAACLDQSGEDAFFRIMGWKEGNFETLPLPSLLSQSIYGGWQYLLMEGARKSDETGPEAVSENETKIIRLMIVDDSAFMTRALSEMISSSGRVKVVATASNGEEALKLIDRVKPDIMTLDINMPIMSGGTALMHIMIKNPCPVVIVSSITNSQSKGQILKFLRLGAVDFLNKPKNTEMEIQKENFVNIICRAADSKTNKFRRYREIKERLDDRPPMTNLNGCKGVVVIYSGPGGHADAIRLISSLSTMKETSCIIMQSMSEELTDIYSTYLDRRSALPVSRLYDGCLLLSGRCYLSATENSWHVESSIEKTLFRDCTENNNGKAGPYSILHSLAEKNIFRVLTVLLSGASHPDQQDFKELAGRGYRFVSQKKETMMLPDFLTLETAPFIEQYEPEELVELINRFENNHV